MRKKHIKIKNTKSVFYFIDDKKKIWAVIFLLAEWGCFTVDVFYENMFISSLPPSRINANKTTAKNIIYDLTDK